MKYEEYENLINEGLKNPDKAPAIFKQVLEELKADTTTLGTQSEKIIEQDSRIRDLQDTNMKLFLSQTSARADEKEVDEKTGQEAVDDFFNKLGKEG